MKKIIPFFILIFLVVSCQKNHYYQVEGYAQGSTYNIIYESLSDEDFGVEIDSILKAFDKSLSVYDSSSVISRVNRNDSTVILDDWFKECISVGQKVSAETNGAFDMTVAPLVDAYGFWKNPHLVMDSSRIDSIMQYVGYQKFNLVNNRIVKEVPALEIDVNAIAQGYSVDIISAFLKAHKCANYLVEIGGELRTKGINSTQESWKVGLDKPIDDPDPDNRKLQTIINLSDKSLATSGNYRKYYIMDGVKYAHTINPLTGYPARNRILSASIIAPSCILADAYATACMVMGLEKSLNFVHSHPDLEAFLIYRGKDGKTKVKMTKGFKKIVKRKL